MAGPNAVLKAWHVMLGRDQHIPWPPGSPSPAPAPVPYVTTALMIGVIPGVTSRFTNTVFTDGLAPAMVRGTDIGPMIPHIGPPSVTMPVEMLTSGSKSHFGAASVQVKDQWGAPGNLACALLGFTNPNLNCGTPIPTPFGLVIAPTTHMETLTIGDMVAGAYLMAFDFAAQAVLNKAGSALGDALGKGAQAIASRLGVTVLSRTAARQAARALGVRANIGPTARALRAAAAARLAKIGDRASKLAIPIGLAVGSPLGISASTARDAEGNQIAPSAFDRATGSDALNVEGNADALGRDTDAAVNDYFNSPAAEEVPASSPPASVSDAGADGAGGPDASVAPGADGGAAGAPNASTAPEGPNLSTAPEAPNASTAPEGPNMSTAPEAPNASTAPEGSNLSTAPEAPNASTAPEGSNLSTAPEAPNASTAPEGPNLSPPDGGETPTGSDGTPDAPFSSPNGGRGGNGGSGGSSGGGR